MSPSGRSSLLDRFTSKTLPRPSVRIVIVGIVTTLILFVLIVQPTGYITKYRDYFKSITGAKEEVLPSEQPAQWPPTKWQPPEGSLEELPSEAQPEAAFEPAPKPPAEPPPPPPPSEPPVEPSPEEHTEPSPKPPIEEALEPPTEPPQEPPAEPPSEPPADAPPAPEKADQQAPAKSAEPEKTDQEAPDKPPPPETESKDDSEIAAVDEPKPKDKPVPACMELPGAKDTLLVIKTGATEALKKLPIHFTTTLTCVPDYLLFADVEMDIDGYHVNDALDHMKEIVDKKSDEWKFKQALNSVRNSGNITDYANMGRDEAWKLDKFKNIPMALKAYKHFPDKKWFVFIDADTSLVWSTMLAWLQKFDHKKPYYMGSQVVIGDDQFAHGGSGYVISHEAIRRLDAQNAADPDKMREHRQFAGRTCCGDHAVAVALRDNGVPVYHSHPIIQGEEPWSLDFTDWHWCHPVSTWHHMTVKEIEEVWRWEQSRLEAGEPPAQFAEAYKHFIAPKITDAERDDWDNVADMSSKKIEHHKKKEEGSDKEVDVVLSEQDLAAIASFGGCKERCHKRKECKQFAWKEGQCRLMDAMRLGKKERGVKSGWIFERMEAYIKSKEGCTTDWMEDR